MGREIVSCVQFPVVVFCLMEFIQLAPLEQRGRGEMKNKTKVHFLFLMFS